jgi:ADP-ribosylglycohydrolase
MLLQLAIGDAYGAGFEYVDVDVVTARNDLSAYVQHPRQGIKPGCYTDDTQMSIAIAEAIISGEPWTLLRGENSGEHHPYGPCPVRARACTNSRANAAGWVT